MVIWVDLVSGNDTTGDGSYTTPYATTAKALTIAGGPHDIRIAKTTDPSTVGGANTWTWTYNSATVTVNADVTASIAVGDYIGKPTANGNGAVETFYRVSARSYASGVTTITISPKYIGTTGTTTGALKVGLVTHGSGTTNISVSGTTISGGWTLATQTQDGYTWIKTSGTGFNVYTPTAAVTLTINKINAFECAGLVSSLQTATLIVSECTVLGNTYPIIMYNVANQVHRYTNNVLSNYASQYAIYMGTIAPGSYLTDNTIIAVAGIQGITFAALTLKNSVTLTGNKVYFSGINFLSSASGIVMDLNDTKIYNTGVAITVAADGVTISNGEVYDCTEGISASGQIRVNNTRIENTTYGARGSSGSGFRGRVELNGLTFVNCQYNVYPDTYSSDIIVSNCSMGAPTSYAIYGSGFCGTIYASNCTITAGSESKMLFQRSVRTIIPQYSICNCNNSVFPDGQYWYFVSLQKSTTTYKTSSPSVKLTSSAAYNTNTCSDMSICAFPTASGVGKTISLWIKGESGWAGSLQIIWKLDGVVIKEETATTSLNTSDFAEHTYSLASGLVTNGGVIEVMARYNPTGSGLSCWIDKDITIS